MHLYSECYCCFIQCIFANSIPMNVYKKRDGKPTSSSGKYKSKIMRQKSKLSEKLYSMAQCNGQFYIAATVANQ